MPSRLTPTSYALLGLLAIRPWSAYELTQYMKRTALARLWPRTEASIYREPKNLLEHRLAAASIERDGERSRTVYEITDAGRLELRSWLARPGAGLSFECEGALQVFFADAGSVHDLRANLAALRQQIEAWMAEAGVRFDGWLDGELVFPERLHYTVIASDLVARIHHAVAEWASLWEQNAAAWSTTRLDPVNGDQARSRLADLKELTDKYQPAASPPTTSPFNAAR
jgi:DNA-binding PadR family transcriptional regulator